MRAAWRRLADRPWILSLVAIVAAVAFSNWAMERTADRQDQALRCLDRWATEVRMREAVIEKATEERFESLNVLIGVLLSGAGTAERQEAARAFQTAHTEYTRNLQKHPVPDPPALKCEE